MKYVYWFNSIFTTKRMLIFDYCVLFLYAIVVGKPLDASGIILCSLPALFFGNDFYHENLISRYTQQRLLLLEGCDERLRQLGEAE